MTGIYWGDDEAKIRTFSSSTKKTAKGVETIVKVEIQIIDHHGLGYLLRQLDELSKPPTWEHHPATKGKRERKHLLALSAPLLRIPHFGDEK